MAKKARKRNPNDPNCPVCTYCGVKPGIEDEHVIAEAFFPAPRPPKSQMILVPACSDCNRGIWEDSDTRINMDEEYVRSIIIFEWHAGAHPAARTLLGNEVRRSVEKNPSIGKLMLRNPRRRDLRLESGVIIPGVLGTEINWPRFRRVFYKITLGLYYHEMKRRLPEDYEVVIEILSMVGAGQSNKLEDPIIKLLMTETRMPGPRRLGGGVFSYAFRQTDELDSALWVMAFYDGAYILVATRPKVRS